MTCREFFKAQVHEKLLKKRQAEGEKHFFASCQLISARDCYQIESFFANQLSASMADLTRKRLLHELGNELQKKQSFAK